MFGSEHDAALHVCLGHTGEHADEVEHYFCAGVGDDGQVGIDAFCHFGGELNFQLAVVLFLIFHCLIVLGYCL